MLFDLNFCICAFYLMANTGMFTFLFARNLSAGIVIRIYIYIYIYIHDVVFLIFSHISLKSPKCAINIQFFVLLYFVLSINPNSPYI